MIDVVAIAAIAQRRRRESYRFATSNGIGGRLEQMPWREVTQVGEEGSPRQRLVGGEEPGDALLIESGPDSRHCQKRPAKLTSSSVSALSSSASPSCSMAGLAAASTP